VIQSPPSGILFITGTGTGVGKTVATAAVAAVAHAAGRRVAVVKLAQTGVHNGPGGDTPDLDTVTRLAGVTDTRELARYPDPLSPEAAARVSGRPPVDFGRATAVIDELSGDRDLVLVEGAGGLLVRYDADGRTLADLAAGLGAGALVVVPAGLGTLNHTALTLEAMRARKISAAGVVVGSWPAAPGLAERENLADLVALAGEPLAGLLPEGSGKLPRAEFLAIARAGLSARLGGRGTSGVRGLGGQGALAGGGRAEVGPLPFGWP
jgi:dethiobiotin synthase